MIFGLTAAVAISSAISPLSLPCREPVKETFGERLLALSCLVVPLVMAFVLAGTWAAAVYFLFIDRLTNGQ